MSRQKKDLWKKHLPKSKREQNEIFKKVILYGSSLWKRYVHSEEDAMKFVEHQISLMEKKEIPFKVGLAVILNLADEQLGTNEGVSYLKAVLEKLLDD